MRDKPLSNLHENWGFGLCVLTLKIGWFDIENDVDIEYKEGFQQTNNRFE